MPDRVAVIQGDRVLGYPELVDRSRRLARYLADRGLGCHRERTDLPGHEVGQDLLAQYLYNGSAYLEGLLGSYRARVAPFNVNYRYVADELRYVLDNARPRAIQYHASSRRCCSRCCPIWLASRSFCRSTTVVDIHCCPVRWTTSRPSRP